MKIMLNINAHISITLAVKGLETVIIILIIVLFFFIDGIDEIQTFKHLWQSLGNVTSTVKETSPLSWCFALMKRTWLRRSTLIISSR